MSNSVIKFLEIRLDEDNSIKNAHFEFCREKNIPYIIISSRNKLADISWDYISYQDGSEKLFSKNDEYLRIEFSKIYKKYGRNNPISTISSASVNFFGILVEDAKAAANDIFDVVNNLVTKNI